MGLNAIHCEPVEQAEPNGDNTQILWVSAGELTELLRVLEAQPAYVVVAVRDETGRRLAGMFSAISGAPVPKQSD